MTRSCTARSPALPRRLRRVWTAPFPLPRRICKLFTAGHRHLISRLYAPTLANPRTVPALPSRLPPSSRLVSLESRSLMLPCPCAQQFAHIIELTRHLWQYGGLAAETCLLDAQLLYEPIRRPSSFLLPPVPGLPSVLLSFAQEWGGFSKPHARHFDERLSRSLDVCAGHRCYRRQDRRGA